MPSLVHWCASDLFPLVNFPLSSAIFSTTCPRFQCDKSKLLLRPGVVTPNTVVQSLTSSLDWVPTLASLTGYHLDASRIVYDGWDLSELLFTEAGQLADKGARDRRGNAFEDIFCVF